MKLERARFATMTEADLDWVVHNERQLQEFPWSRGNFQDALVAGYICRMMYLDDTPVAFAVMLRVLDEAHLLDIGVTPAWQNQGVGRCFLEYLFNEARRHEATQCFLEVRPSNAPARSLYHRLGFVPVGRRKGYYPCRNGEREDALVLRLEL